MFPTIPNSERRGPQASPPCDSLLHSRPAPHIRGYGPGQWGAPENANGLKTPCKDGSGRNQQYLAPGSRALSCDDAFKLSRSIPKEQQELGSLCRHDRAGLEPTQGRAFWQKQPTRIRPEVRRALRNRLEGQSLLQGVLVKINRFL